MKEEEKKKVNKEGPKENKKVPDAEEVKKELPKPTVEELQKQVIFLTKQSAEAQKRAKEAEDRAKSEDAKIQAALSQYVRLQADFDNFRRRTKENEAKAADTYKAETLKSFLPVLDNFELALSHMKKDDSGEAYLKGFELLQKQLVKIMTDFGVKEIDAKGKAFDPHFHEAVMMVQSDEMEDETVALVFQKGYLYKDTVLRPAKVQVVKNS
ncbi:nucleotide exchange factor GrpE [uncultured Dialister sp.]|jgi:molecular chaperone GrpE|uniref:nucleotide exchange factor GrpE n=1 Tax=uncultured Dialister sp. TaxID=278064 RepID=UPI0025FC1DAE|nr:nucleotide exchange factor GrpE [uncultured Dialister sp.]